MHYFRTFLRLLAASLVSALVAGGADGYGVCLVSSEPSSPYWSLAGEMRECLGVVLIAAPIGGLLALLPAFILGAFLFVGSYAYGFFCWRLPWTIVGAAIGAAFNLILGANLSEPLFYRTLVAGAAAGVAAGLAFRSIALGGGHQRQRLAAARLGLGLG
jgi:hypothetical protein